jgi:hypothetical protein
MELTLRGETLEALKWKVYRTNRRNFGRTASGLLLAIRSALTTGLSSESTAIFGERTVDITSGHLSEAPTLQSTWLLTKVFVDSEGLKTKQEDDLNSTFTKYLVCTKFIWLTELLAESLRWRGPVQ